ncbi:DUF6551 family protein [Butyrivibrio sp. AC2005]|uniref:DUF6551 family protein n=1 Tax=Butyrivibrio sp. AC2005 TaxID=1280672 RepID=UPI0003FCAB97|nr:DUF6551 family protein [Butyrivibrio sp. AC2005]
MQTDLTAFVPNVHFEQIPIKNLVSNQDYQRNLSLKHVQKAAANFNLYQINPVKVSRRDGINYVFNGQHTIEIVALVSGSRETPVWCMVYEDLEYAEEAEIFANQMKYNKPLLPYEIFMANIEAGSDEQILIKDLVESFDLELSSSGAPGTICAISTLEEIFEKQGYEMLSRILGLIIATWEGAPMSLSSNILKGVSRFLAAYGDEVRDEAFKEKLSQISIKELTRTAKDRRAGSLGYAEALVLAYNNRKSNGVIKMEKLYAKKKKATEKEEETA